MSFLFFYYWSGREDSNLRPHGPEPCALPDCATPRKTELLIISYRFIEVNPQKFYICGFVVSIAAFLPKRLFKNSISGGKSDNKTTTMTTFSM
jgi:hypothetical protein